MEKRKQPIDDSLQKKRKRAANTDNEEVAGIEGSFMADARCMEWRDKFVSINPTDDYEGRVTDIKEHFGCLPLHLCLPISNG